MIFKKYIKSRDLKQFEISIWDNHVKPTDDCRDQGLKSLKILRAIRVDLNIYDITPSRLSLGPMLLTEIQAPSVGLCYVICTLATRSKKSSIIRLVYKPFVLLTSLVPHHSFTAHTPLYFFGQRCFFNHLIATV